MPCKKMPINRHTFCNSALKSIKLIGLLYNI